MIKDYCLSWPPTTLVELASTKTTKKCLFSSYDVAGTSYATLVATRERHLTVFVGACLLSSLALLMALITVSCAFRPKMRGPRSTFRGIGINLHVFTRREGWLSDGSLYLRCFSFPGSIFLPCFLSSLVRFIPSPPLPRQIVHLQTGGRSLQIELFG